MKDLNAFYKIYIFLVFLMLTSNLFGQAAKTGRKIIVIDPGHGGIDSGAIGIDGIMEKDVVLDIALEMVRINETIFDSRLEIYLTRYSDTLISLNDRTKLTKTLQADVFISLHCNQADNPNAKGTEVYVSNANGKYLTQSILMGYAIEKALVNHIGLESRGVKFANFQVLRETVEYCPAVLVELGFLSNIKESAFLGNLNNFSSLAIIILRVIIKRERS